MDFQDLSPSNLSPKWYRAKILDASKSPTKVFYIDYGNSDDASEIRALPEDIINIQPLCIVSSLKPPEDVKSWSKEATKKFTQLADSGRTEFKFSEMSDNNARLFLNGDEVVKILAPLCDKKQSAVTGQRHAEAADIVGCAQQRDGQVSGERKDRNGMQKNPKRAVKRVNNSAYRAADPTIPNNNNV